MAVLYCHLFGACAKKKKKKGSKLSPQNWKKHYDLYNV